MTMSADTRELAAALDEEVAGPVLEPGHLGFDHEIKTFNLTVTHTPAVVVGATSADDVRATVRHAAKAGLPVGVQATGHGALASIDKGVLISTRRMNSVHVNPRNATASVGAGTRWADVIKAAAVHGLAPLSGSCSSVGAVGYTLGGGVPILARTFGYAADHVRSLEVVTADGLARHVDAGTEPELFWALRGGQGNVGIVTSMVIDLVPVSHVYGGSITFSGLAAPALLRAYREWTRDLPETMSTTLSLVRLPPLPAVPESRRGQFVVDLQLAYVGDRGSAERLLAPMRAAAPAIMDTVADIPYADSDMIYNAPTDPLPLHDRCALLTELTPEAIDALLGVAGPGVQTPLVTASIKHLGGALSRPPAGGNAVGGRDAGYSVFLVGLLMPEIAAITVAAVDGAAEALRPHSTGGTLVNMHGRPGDAADRARAWPAAIYARLRAVKASYDPGNMFRFGHAIIPADDAAGG
jgi:FAD/FMN-containing dehydrogenase